MRKEFLLLLLLSCVAGCGTITTTTTAPSGPRLRSSYPLSAQAMSTGEKALLQCVAGAVVELAISKDRDTERNPFPAAELICELPPLTLTP